MLNRRKFLNKTAKLVLAGSLTNLVLGCADAKKPNPYLKYWGSSTVWPMEVFYSRELTSQEQAWAYQSLIIHKNNLLFGATLTYDGPPLEYWIEVGGSVGMTGISKQKVRMVNTGDLISLPPIYPSYLPRDKQIVGVTIDKEIVSGAVPLGNPQGFKGFNMVNEKPIISVSFGKKGCLRGLYTMLSYYYDELCFERVPTDEYKHYEYWARRIAVDDMESKTIAQNR